MAAERNVYNFDMQKQRALISKMLDPVEREPQFKGSVRILQTQHRVVQ